jgi:hypothetical protein
MIIIGTGGSFSWLTIGQKENNFSVCKLEQ